MTLDARGILAAVESHAAATGLFETVNKHEPKRAPGNGLHAAIWVQSLRPIRGGSGLASTSYRLEVSERIYNNMLADPQNDIDPRVLEAVDVLMAAYTGDFTLGDRVRNVDLLGAHGGDGLSADAGYLEQDGKMYRVMVITLPLIINDLYTQAP